MRKNIFMRAVSLGLCATMLANSSGLSNIEVVKASSNVLTKETFINLLEPYNISSDKLNHISLNTEDISTYGVKYDCDVTNGNSKTIEVKDSTFLNVSLSEGIIDLSEPEGISYGSYKVGDIDRVVAVYQYNNKYYPEIRNTNGENKIILADISNLCYRSFRKLRKLNVSEVNAIISEPDYSNIYNDGVWYELEINDGNSDSKWTDEIGTVDMSISGTTLALTANGQSYSYNIPINSKTEGFYVYNGEVFPCLSDEDYKWFCLGLSNENKDISSENFISIDLSSDMSQVINSDCSIIKKDNSNYALIGINHDYYWNDWYSLIQDSGTLQYTIINAGSNNEKVIFKSSQDNYYVSNEFDSTFDSDLLEDNSFSSHIKECSPDYFFIKKDDGYIYVNSYKLNKLMGKVITSEYEWIKVDDISNLQFISESLISINDEIIKISDKISKYDFFPSANNITSFDIDSTDNAKIFKDTDDEDNNVEFDIDYVEGENSSDLKYEVSLGANLDYYINPHNFISNNGEVYLLNETIFDEKHRKLTQANYNVKNVMDSINTVIKMSREQFVYIDKSGKLRSIGTGSGFNKFEKAYNDLNLTNEFVTINDTIYMVNNGHLYKAEVGDYAVACGYGNNYSVDNTTGTITVTKGSHITKVKDPKGVEHTEESFKITVSEKGYYEFIETFDYGVTNSKIVKVSISSEKDKKPEVSAINNKLYFTGNYPIEYSEDSVSWTDYVGEISYSKPLYVRYKDLANANIEYVSIDNNVLSVKDTVESKLSSDYLSNYFYINDDGELILIPNIDSEIAKMFTVDECGRLLDANLNVIKDVKSAYTRIKVRSGCNSSGEILSFDQDNGLGDAGRDAGVYTYVDKNGNVISSDYRYFTSPAHKDELSLTDKIKVLFVNGYSYITGIDGNVSKVKDDSVKANSDMCYVYGSVQDVYDNYFNINGSTLESVIEGSENIELGTKDNYKVEDGKLKVKKSDSSVYVDVDTSAISGAYVDETTVPTISKDASTYSNTLNNSKIAVFESNKVKWPKAEIVGSFSSDKEAYKKAAELGEGYYSSIGTDDRNSGRYANLKTHDVVKITSEYPKLTESIDGLHSVNNNNVPLYGIYDYEQERKVFKEYALNHQSEIKYLSDYNNLINISNNGSDSTVEFTFSEDYARYYLLSSDGETAILTKWKGKAIPLNISMFNDGGVFSNGFIIVAIDEKTDTNFYDKISIVKKGYDEDFWTNVKFKPVDYIDIFYAWDDSSPKRSYMKILGEFRNGFYFTDGTKFFNDNGYANSLFLRNPYLTAYTYNSEQLENVVHCKEVKTMNCTTKQYSLKQSDGSVYVQNKYELDVPATSDKYLYIPFKYSNENANIQIYGMKAEKASLLKEYNAYDLKNALYTDDTRKKQYIRTSALKSYAEGEVFDNYKIVYNNMNGINLSKHEDNTGFSAYDVIIQRFDNAGNDECPEFVLCQKVSEDLHYHNSYYDTDVDIPEEYSLVDKDGKIYLYYTSGAGTWVNTGETLDYKKPELSYTVNDTNWTNQSVDITSMLSSGTLSSVSVFKEGESFSPKYTVSQCLNTNGYTFVYDGVNTRLYIDGVDSGVTYSNLDPVINSVDGIIDNGDGSSKYIVSAGRYYSNPLSLLMKNGFTGTYIKSDASGNVLSYQSLKNGFTSDSAIMVEQQTVSENGTYVIQGIDGKGNQYTNKAVIGNIDRLVPAVSIIEDGVNQIKLSGKDAEATATDGCSGIDKIYYSLAKPINPDASSESYNINDYIEGEWFEYNSESIKYDHNATDSKTASLITTTTPYIYVYAIDKAGNKSDTNVLEIGGKLNVEDAAIYTNGRTTVRFAGIDKAQSLFGADKNNTKIDFKYKVEDGPEIAALSGASNDFDLSFTDPSIGEFTVKTEATKLLSSGFTKKGSDEAKLIVVKVDKPAISGGTTIKVSDALIQNDTVDTTYFRYIENSKANEIETKEFEKYIEPKQVAPGSYRVQAYTVSKDKHIEGEVADVVISISATAIDIEDEITYSNGRTDVKFKTKNPKSGVTYMYYYEIGDKTENNDKYYVTEDTQVKMMGVGSDDSTGTLTDNIKVIKANNPTISDVEINGKTVKITQGAIVNDVLGKIEYKIDNGEWKDYELDSDIEIPKGKHTVYAKQTTLNQKFETFSDSEVYVADLRIKYKVKHENKITHLTFEDVDPCLELVYSYNDVEGNKVDVTKDTTVKLKEVDGHGNYTTEDVDLTVTSTEKPNILDVKPNSNKVSIEQGEIVNGSLQGIMYSIDGDNVYTLYTGEIELPIGKHLIKAYQVVIPNNQQDSEDIVISDIASKEVIVKELDIKHSIKYLNGSSTLTFEDSKEPKNYSYSYTIKNNSKDGNTVTVSTDTDAVLKEVDEKGNSKEKKVHINVIHTDTPIIGELEDRKVTISAGTIKGDKLGAIYTRIDGGEWTNKTEFKLKPGVYKFESYQVTKDYNICSDIVSKTITVDPSMASYIVKYVDKDDNKLAEPKKGNAKQGSILNEKAVDVKGYIPLKNTQSLKLKSKSNKLTFVYKKGLFNYTVKYVDEDGNKLLDNVTKKALYEEEVTEKAAKIKGYIPDEASKSVTIDTENNLIVFTYIKGGYDYSVRYVDEDGKDLAKKAIKGAKFKDIVKEKAINIKGYVPDKHNKSIKIGVKDNKIVFHYSKDTYKYVIKMSTKDGVILKEVTGKQKYKTTVDVMKKIDSFDGYKLEKVADKDKKIVISDDENKNFVTVYYSKINNDKQTEVKTGDVINKGLMGLFAGSLIVFTITSRKKREE